MKHYIYISQHQTRSRLTPLCQCCGASLFPGEVYYELEENTLCQNCTEVFVRRMLHPYRRQVSLAEVRE